MLAALLCPDSGLLPCRECRAYNTRKGKKRARADGFQLPAPARSLAMAYGPAWEREHAYEHQPPYEQGMSAIVRFTVRC